MATRESSRKNEKRRREGARKEAERKRERALQIKAGLAFGLALVVLAGVFVISRSGDSGATSGSGEGAAGQFAFAAGEPGPGARAPDIELASTGGETFNLGDRSGKTVLLYFQEGLTCQPCWDQIVDLEGEMSALRGLGIDEVVSITTDPIDQIEQKVADEGISTPVLSDPELTVSEAYGANQYGMMGDGRDGHSFLVVGPDGTIRWRADYGGPPNFTMYVPVPNLLADIEQGLGETS